MYVPNTEIEKPTVSGQVDGNAFAVMAAVTNALRRAGCDADVLDAYRTAAMSGDYGNLLRVSCQYVDFDI